jgi:Flp pilus assembly protein TadD
LRRSLRQSLAAALLEAGRTEEAERVFRKGLDANPNHAWLLHGLYRAQAARGDAEAAAATKERFQAAWRGEPAGRDLSRL